MVCADFKFLKRILWHPRPPAATRMQIHPIKNYLQRGLIPVPKLLTPPLTLHTVASSIIHSYKFLQILFLCMTEKPLLLLQPTWLTGVQILTHILSFEIVKEPLPCTSGSQAGAPKLVLKCFSNFQNNKQKSVMSCSDLNSKFNINSMW